MDGLDEHRDKGQRIQHGCGELDVTTPERTQPVEHLDRRWYSDHDSRKHECCAEQRIHTRLEHVVTPHDEAKECDTSNSEYHRLVSVDRLA